MILDKLLFERITPIGESILKKSGLKRHPSNVDEMACFIETVNSSMKKSEFDGLLIGNIFFSFVSSIEVRDRKTTARTFEDIFSALFSLNATDTAVRQNPVPPKEVMALDIHNTRGDDWKISSDLATNKREKADLFLGDYSISLKTLRGFAYDRYGKMMPKVIKNSDGEDVKNNENGEVNVGSLSFRALLKGILTDDDLAKLKDRKGGLGSGGAFRESVLNKIKAYGKQEMFLNRLGIFMNYVYDDDLYIVLKSHYKITWYLIPAKSFIDCIVMTYKYDEPNFERIWYRWENNNLRMDWKPIIEKMDKYHLKYRKIEMLLGDAVHSSKIIEFKKNISKSISEEIKKLL